MSTSYLWIKTFHLVFVISWMAVLFYLPRILVNISEAWDEPAVRARLLLMGKRLSRFGQVMFGLTFVFGAWLWLGYGIRGGWLHAKLVLVAALVAYGIVIGRMLKNAEAGKPLPSSKALRWINELPLLALIPIIWLVLAKPF